MKTPGIKWSVKWLGAILGLSTLLIMQPTRAASFTEIDDAGESLLDAAPVTSAQSTPLDFIAGVLSGDVDLFKIFLTGNQQFSATTRSAETDQIPIDLLLGIPVDLVIDPKLYLFDAAGNGVYSNDDLFGSTQSVLTSGGLSPLAAGIYFLGISGSGLSPVSANGEIFPSSLFDQVVGPTGPGGSAPLAGFQGSSTASGRYQISLTGAQTIAAANPAASVPEPAMTLALLVLGLGLVVSQASTQLAVTASVSTQSVSTSSGKQPLG